MNPDNEILDPYGTPIDKAAAELLVVRQVKTGTGKRILRMAVVLVVEKGRLFTPHARPVTLAESA